MSKTAIQTATETAAGQLQEQLGELKKRGRKTGKKARKTAKALRAEAKGRAGELTDRATDVVAAAAKEDRRGAKTFAALLAGGAALFAVARTRMRKSNPAPESPDRGADGTAPVP